MKLKAGVFSEILLLEVDYVSREKRITNFLPSSISQLLSMKPLYNSYGSKILKRS
jgi:hypothetical protein